jgi:hypothetical protein
MLPNYCVIDKIKNDSPITFDSHEMAVLYINERIREHQKDGIDVSNIGIFISDGWGNVSFMGITPSNGVKTFFIWKMDMTK